MKTKKLILLLISLPLAFGGTCLSVVAADSVPANGWEEMILEESYRYNSYLDIETLCYCQSGTRFPASHTLTYPDGTVTGDSRVLLNVPGEYVLSYTTYVNNTIHSKEYKFNVDFNIVSYKNPTKTSFEYGNLNDIEAGDSSIRTINAEGLYVRLAANDTLTFNEYIDLSNITPTDELVKMFAMPDAWHEEEMNAIQFKFIDSEDPTNYMTILSTRYSDYGYTYSMAAGKDQILTGWERGSGKSIKHINDGWGTVSNHSFGGTAITSFTAKDYYKINVDERCLTFSYDTAENCLYTFSKKMGDAGIIGNADLSEVSRVCDFDNPDDFTTLWNGFKSNKVKLQVNCIGTTKETSNLCFVKVFGLDLSSATVNKTEGPEITIDHTGPSPLGEINKAYKIPNAIAYDEYFGDCNVTKNVYYRYDSDTYRRQISVVNDCFAPTKPGLYAIVYRAKDYLGNVSEKIMQVIVNESLDAIDFNLPTLSNGFVGLETSILDIENISGGSGLYTTQIMARLGAENIEIKNNKFIPMKAGTWAIDYTVTDYIGNSVTKTANLEVGVKDGYVPETFPVMYPGFVLNNTYKLPVLTLSKFDANGNKTSINSKVRINGTTYTSGDDFLPTSDNDEGTFTVEYFEGQEVFRTYVVPYLNNSSKTVDAEGLTKTEFAGDRYFICNGTRTWVDSGVQIKANNKETITQFANFVSAIDFNLDIGGFTYFNNNNSITFSLIDCDDEDNVANIKIVKTSSGYSLIGDDEKTINIVDTDDFSIKFDGEKFTINNSFVFENNLSSRMDGAILKIKSEKQIGYIIKNIQGSQVSKSLKNLQDKQGPSIAFTDTYGGTYEINDVYKICKANIYDLFSPNVVSSLTVRDPDGKIVTSQDGEVLENVNPSKDRYIKLTKFGSYKFEYKTSETSEYKMKFNSYDKTYLIDVVDSVSPTISFKQSFVTKAKVNSLVILPDYVVNDNVSSRDNITIRIGVTNPDGFTSYLTGNSFYVNYEGTYKITYFIFDEAGNVASVNKYVEVTK